MRIFCKGADQELAEIAILLLGAQRSNGRSEVMIQAHAAKNGIIKCDRFEKWH